MPFFLFTAISLSCVLQQNRKFLVMLRRIVRPSALLLAVPQRRWCAGSSRPPQPEKPAPDAGADAPVGASPATPSGSTDADAPFTAADDETPSVVISKAKRKPSGGAEKESPIPRGFERFYHKGFPLQSATTEKIATEGVGLREQSTIRAVEVDKKTRRSRRWRVFFLGGAACFLAYRNRDFLLTGTGPFDGAAASRVMVDLDRHAARFYDKDNTLLGMETFIDFFSFENDLAAAKGDATRLFISVPLYFPAAAILFLWVLPILAGMHRGFDSGLAIARREAMSVKPASSRFRFKMDQKVKTKLNDVAGLTEVKFEVMEIIGMLKNPAKYTELGARLPRGVLLDGPPGVGKTLLAKAVAGEAKVPFIACSGSEFEEVYVGVGAQRVRELFTKAKESRPCVVFIDEIDTFGRKRRNDRSKNSRGTINALLSELDGFGDSTGIIVLAATNRADILDDALTRSGRFDRKISVSKPPLKDRAAIAHVHLAPLTLAPALREDDVAQTLATLTPGCTGADLKNICNEAAITASRDDLDGITMPCFHKALERVLVGLERKAKKLTDAERERLAYHEAGHVVLAWFQRSTDPVLQTSIMPRGGLNEGLTRRLPVEKFITTQAQLREGMVQKLGGYVAEEFFFENVSTNAAEDLHRVTSSVSREILTYGMHPQTVGHFGFEEDDSAIMKPYGKEKQEVIDGIVASTTGDVLQAARAMLQTHLEKVRIVAALLLRNETVSAKELYLVLGERPDMTAEFRDYLTSS
jgi:AFG3 family protein